MSLIMNAKAQIEIKQGMIVNYKKGKQAQSKALILSSFTDNVFLARDLATNKRFRLEQNEVVN